MKKLGLGFLLSLIVITFSRASVAGVWDEMQAGSQNSVVGKVVSIEVAKDSVNFEIEEAGSGATRSLKVCADSAQGSRGDFYPSESHAAAVFNQRLELLREAYRSGQTVQLGFRGPWSPCLASVKLSAKH